MRKGTYYTDGSYTPKHPNYYGVGVYGVVEEDNKIVETVSIKKVGTNPTMRQIDGELEACITAIKNGIELDLDEIEIVYDYMGVGLWPERKWQTKKQATSDYVKEVDELKTKFSPNHIRFSWVKGHNGTHGNEIADDLAKEAITDAVEKDLNLKISL